MTTSGPIDGHRHTLRRVVLLSAASLAGLWVAACDRPMSEPSRDTMRHQVQLRLDDTWTSTPWTSKTAQRPPNTTEASLSTTFNLPAEWVGDGSILELEGLRWTADIRVNDVRLPVTTGGPGPTQVLIGPQLESGANTIQITLNGRGNTPAVLVGHDTKEALLTAPPSITLRPSIGLSHATATLSSEGVELSAWTRDAPAGSSVHFEAWLDGKKLADWGSGAVHSGKATVTGPPWTGERWSMERSFNALFLLNATLRDATGEPLDHAVWRTAFRQFGMSGDQMILNGSPIGLVGLRKKNEGLLQTIKILDPAGLNVVEVHGEMPSRSLLRDTDELGVPIAVLPRCDGHMQVNLAEVKSRQQEIHAQNQRMIDQAGTSPSILLWSTEGGDLNRAGFSVGQALIESMRADPMSRVVTSWDLPAFAIPEAGPNEVTTDQRMRAGLPPRSPFWIVEFHLEHENVDPDVDTLARALVASIEQGAVGGVLPGAKNILNPEWAPSWAHHTAALGLTPLQLDGRRAHARAQIKGLSPGDLASIHFEGGGHHATVAGSSDPVVLEAWHSGDATVRFRDLTTTTRLLRGTWHGLGWTGQPSLMDAGKAQ